MTRRKKDKPPKKPNKSGHSALSDHSQNGKTFTSPMNTLNPTSVPWLRDVFPSLIWLCSSLESLGLPRGSDVVTKVLERLAPFMPTDVPSEGPTKAIAPVLDGSMESFDFIPEERRREALDALQDDGLYEEAFPWLLVGALSKYENVPGEWILKGWEGNDQIVSAEGPEAFLSDVVIGAWHGRNEVATRAKMLYVRAYVTAGRLLFSDQISYVQLLPRYPNGLTQDERDIVDSSMRATFGAMWGGLITGDLPDGATGWAGSFWRQNWALYTCQNSTNGAATEASAEDSDQDVADPPWMVAQLAWDDQVSDIADRFYVAHAAADPDLYAPDRNEVLTGITNRHLRSTSAMIRYPGLWSAEHGAATIRSLVEGRIVLKWLIRKNDPDLFAKFKNYGRGHLKLHVLHLREYSESLSEPVEGLEETIKSMEDLLNRDLMEKFQDISIDAAFTKATTRDMAYAVGLIREYRLVFAPMSANVHSEWIALEQYALTPCANPLHRGHRIPNKDVRIEVGPEVVDLAIDILDNMVNDYCADI